jgi:chromosome segregation ATPase
VRADQAEIRAAAADTDRRTAEARADAERALWQEERTRLVLQIDGFRAERDQERVRADRAEQGREGERARADALRDRIEAMQEQLAEAEAEGAASDVEIANLTAQLKQARAEAQAAQIAQSEVEADAAELRQAEAERRARGLLARLRAAWRGE